MSSERVGRGPRAVERLVLEALDRLLEAARSEPALFARPVRVVVPSTSLAQHLAARLAHRRGRAVLGVSIRTAWAVACEILARAGVALPRGEGLFEVMVRRAARAEPALAPLAELADGHVAVAASVRDLLDAGLDPAHAEALDEALAAEPGPRDPVERARAVARVAIEIAREIEAERLGHRSRLFRLAREAFERDPEAVLPSRAILIHGFADATGVVTDLLEALVRRAGATLFLDRPPDPAEPSREDPGARFGDRFAARVLGAPPTADPAEEPLGELRVLHAQGPWAEARAVAEEIRAALDAGGVVPEELGVVARDLGAHRLALRAQLARLAVPFSGLGEQGPPGPGGRRLAELRALLRDGPRARAERWLEALELDAPGAQSGSRARGRAPRVSPTERADLRVGLHALGGARVADVAALATADEGADGDVALPVRVGLVAAEEGTAFARKRYLRRPLLDAAIARARDLVERLRALESPGQAAERPRSEPQASEGSSGQAAERPRSEPQASEGSSGQAAERPRSEPQASEGPSGRRPLAAGAAALRELARSALGWRDGDPGAAELERALARLGPPGFEVDAEELRLLFERALAGEGCVELGGAGGGAQVLNATEARARSFARLWVVGLARDAFPRAVVEDPLLPDALRARLRDLLPDLARKRDGHDEERFLFAQLAAASPRVALVASSCDDDGRARELSPLVERLRRAPHVGEPERAPSTTGRSALAAAGPRPAHERALLAGLHGSAADFDALLPVALEEAWRGEGAPPADARALAAGRLGVLRELDRPAHRAATLGPYFGFVGPLGAAGDPRRGPLAVTTLEGLFRCPWQTFLERVLRIEAPPDAGGELPAADPRRLGSLVHRVLERVAKAGLAAPVEKLAEATQQLPVALAWPAPEELDAIVCEAAREILHAEGIALPGFERVLALAAREPLGVARELDAAAARSGSGVVGAEVVAALRLAGAAGEPRELLLRVDRVERAGGALCLTDFKTGKPKVAQAKPEKRREALLRLVRSGELLQGPAYAAAVRELAGGGGVGRYVYLRADARDAARELAIGADDAELAGAFGSALGRALAVWDAGSFFPRLAEAESEGEGKACRTCLLKEACVKGDSSARGRLVRWAEAPASRGRSAAETALLGLWRREGPG
jgi:hypothetical protein